MRVRFNESSKLIDSIVFPDKSVIISNTAEELRMYCPDNKYLTSVERGKIISHIGSCMFKGATGLTSFTTQLNGIVSAESMFEGCRSLTSITSNCEFLKETSDYKTFNNPNTGGGMFKNCTNLVSVDLGALEHLYNATMMFCSCSALTSFTASLNSLVYAEGMFYGCEGLGSVEVGDLPELMYAKSMFSHTAIKSFRADTSMLQGATYMFSNCSQMSSCSVKLNKCTDLSGIFDGCTSLRSLSVGAISVSMDVSSCPLTLSSITEIADNAVAVSDGEQKKAVTIRVSDYTKKLSGFSKVQKTFKSKGWEVL